MPSHTKNHPGKGCRRLIAQPHLWNSAGCRSVFVAKQRSGKRSELDIGSSSRPGPWAAELVETPWSVCLAIDVADTTSAILDSIRLRGFQSPAHDVRLVVLSWCEQQDPAFPN